MNMKIDANVPGSFRDPSGFLFKKDGNIYRQINLAYKKNYDMSSFQRDTRYYRIEPISMTGGDVTTVQFESDTFGLNIGVNVYNDYTEVFIRNKSLFWEAIKQQMAKKVLELMVSSVRANDVERINQAKLSLYGIPEQGIDGIFPKVSRAIKDVKKMLFYQPRISKGTIR